MAAIADLFPTSAIAHALHQQDVWPRERRRPVAKATAATRYGFFIEDLVTKVEAAAAAEGSNIVTDSHFARAISEWASTIANYGVAGDALIARTQEREAADAPAPGPKRPRIVGAARGMVLESTLAGLDLNVLCSAAASNWRLCAWVGQHCEH